MIRTGSRAWPRLCAAALERRRDQELKRNDRFMKRCLLLHCLTAKPAAAGKGRRRGTTWDSVETPAGRPRRDESQQTETVSLLVKRLLHLLLGPALARGGKDWRVAQPWPPTSSGEPKPRRQPTA